MVLAKRLKFHREQAGLSQANVANVLQISRQAISKWETGRGYPDLDNLVLLSELYEVSIDALLKRNEKLKKQVFKNKDEKLKKQVFKNEIEIAVKRQRLNFIKRRLSIVQKLRG